MFLGFLPSFFLQSRSAVLDCGHTPGQHAQCHNTPTWHIQKVHAFVLVLCFFNLEPWLWTVLQPLQALLPLDKQPATHVFNLQTNVCQTSERHSNLTEGDLHQCQAKEVMALHNFRHRVQVLSCCMAVCCFTATKDMTY